MLASSQMLFLLNWQPEKAHYLIFFCKFNSIYSDCNWFFVVKKLNLFPNVLDRSKISLGKSQRRVCSQCGTWVTFPLFRRWMERETSNIHWFSLELLLLSEPKMNLLCFGTLLPLSWSHHPKLLGQLISCFLEFSTRFCLHYIVTFTVSGIKSLSAPLFPCYLRVNKTLRDGSCSMPVLHCSSGVWFWIGNLIMKKHVFFSSEPSTLSHLWDCTSTWRSEMKWLQHDQINLLWGAHITTWAHIIQLALASCSGESWAYMCRSTELFLLSGDGESEKIPSGQGWGLMRKSAVRQLNFTSVC